MLQLAFAIHGVVLVLLLLPVLMLMLLSVLMLMLLSVLMLMLMPVLMLLLLRVLMLLLLHVLMLLPSACAGKFLLIYHHRLHSSSSYSCSSQGL